MIQGRGINALEGRQVRVHTLNDNIDLDAEYGSDATFTLQSYDDFGAFLIPVTSGKDATHSPLFIPWGLAYYTLAQGVEGKTKVA